MNHLTSSWLAILFVVLSTLPLLNLLLRANLDDSRYVALRLTSYFFVICSLFGSAAWIVLLRDRFYPAYHHFHPDHVVQAMRSGAALYAIILFILLMLFRRSCVLTPRRSRRTFQEPSDHPDGDSKGHSEADGRCTPPTKSLAKLNPLYLTVSLFTILLAALGMRSEAVARHIAQKISKPKPSRNIDMVDERVYAQYVLDSTHQMQTPVSPEQAKCLDKIIFNNEMMLSGSPNTSAGEASTDSASPVSRARSSLSTKLEATQEVVRTLSSVVKSSRNPTLLVSVEAGLGKLADGYLAFSSEMGISSSDSPSSMIFTNTADELVASYVERTGFYIENTQFEAANISAKNYRTMQNIYGLINGSDPIALRVKLLKKCVASLKKSNTPEQHGVVELLVKTICETVSPAEFSASNEFTASTAIAQLGELSLPSDSSSSATKISIYSKCAIRRWRDWGKNRKLPKVSSTAEQVLTTVDLPLKERLKLFLHDTDPILTALEYHRGSWQFYGVSEHPEIEIAYQREARQIQFDRWNRIIDIPELTQARQLHNLLRKYFHYAERAITAKEAKNWAEKKRLSKSADQLLKECNVLSKELHRQLRQMKSTLTKPLSYPVGQK